MKAMVMAAGLGTRLRPLTDFLPKPMMPVANRPVLHHLLNLLRRHDVTEVGVNLHAFPEMIQRYFGDGAALDLSILWSHEPELLGTANVWHLATPFRGRLHDPSVTALELVAALHPTPAVCGSPRETAREALEYLEPIERGGYAGPLGWMDANGDGEWAIALRCAEITGSTARLYAGAGIVADSEPEAELDETERKFRALLDALRWG